MIAALIACGGQLGCAWMTSAAVPAICGVAIDVPDSVIGPLPVPAPVDTIAAPGAVTSGFRWESGERGPPDVNGARPVWIGVPSVSEIVRPSRCTRAKPSDVALVAVPRTP